MKAICEMMEAKSAASRATIQPVTVGMIKFPMLISIATNGTDVIIAAMDMTVKKEKAEMLGRKRRATV
jgi:hypothetical protein